MTQIKLIAIDQDGTLLGDDGSISEQNVLAIKLEQCKDDEILLEEDEYQRIKKAVDAFKGFNRNDVELVTRINDAELVEVEPKK